MSIFISLTKFSGFPLSLHSHYTIVSYSLTLLDWSPLLLSMSVLFQSDIVNSCEGSLEPLRSFWSDPSRPQKFVVFQVSMPKKLFMAGASALYWLSLMVYIWLLVAVHHFYRFKPTISVKQLDY